MTEITSPALEIVDLPVGEIDPNPWNPNKQSEKVARAERESIQRFGFIDPVTVRPHPEQEGRWQIIDGEHRWREASSLGHTTIPAVVLPLGEAEARKLTVVLNETRGEADVVLLGALLADLKRLDEDSFADALPYTDGELEHLLSLGDEDWDRFTQTPVEETNDEVESPGHEVVLSLTEQQYEEFTAHVNILRRELRLESVPDAVLAAVRQQALVANQSSGDS